jgi:photosystem II stability/assembly factor-like uncharacterized protein
MNTVLYLGTGEGVVTLIRDQAGSWQRRNEGLKGWAVQEVAVVPGSPNNVLAATRGDGVWSSDDFGATWKKPCHGNRGPGKVQCLAFDPERPGRVYAGCEPIDIFASDDLGAHWERLDSVWDVPSVASIDYPLPTVEPHVRDIAIDPKDPKTIYAALQVGSILKSTNRGASWKLIEKGFDSDVHTIVIDPTRTDTVLIATGGHDARQEQAPGRALYKSADGGESWAAVGMEFSQEYSVPLAMDPRNSKVLFSALADGNPGQWRRPSGADSVMIRTTDGGSTWKQLTKGLEGVDVAFPAAFAFDEDVPEHLYTALNTGKLLASADNGDSWTVVEVNLPPVSDMKCVCA